MWRVWSLCLPLCLIGACVATDPQKSIDSSDTPPAAARIVRTTDLPLTGGSVRPDGQLADRTFESSGISGWLDATGAWQIRSKVPHSRLRCGVYEVGMQLGRGDAGCSDVRWVTDVEYVTRERQCNSATRIHSGRGQIPIAQFETASCVRVVVRCEGTC
jgi:hypothetical protein